MNLERQKRRKTRLREREEGNLQEQEDLRDDEEKSDEEQAREEVYEDGDTGSPG
jgi:hypothetical protein